MPRPQMPPDLFPPLAESLLDTPVRELMTPGVVVVSENASLGVTFAAMASHAVNAVLVLGAQHGRPLGWVTARGLLAWLSEDHRLVAAREAITESVKRIPPSATAQEAASALSETGVTHLLVCPGADAEPEGVVSAANLVALCAARGG
ncbi:MAG: CBS domain-containing protein [Thermoleophilaceae bacterium]|nr:CBS domain-containing protein [Thermoleophilaceae bacterium]